MFLLIPSLLILSFLWWRLIHPLDSSRLVKLAMSAFVLTWALKFSIYSFLGGSVFAPHLSRPTLIFWEGATGALFVLVFLLIVRDVLTLILRLLKKKCTLAKQSKVAWGLIALAFLGGQWGSLNAVAVPEIKEVAVFLKALPQELEGFKMVQLTDTHIRRLLNKEWLDAVVEKTNAQQPDIILLTGDYTDALVQELASEVQAFGRLRAPFGVVGVTGNHEYYTDAREWQQFFAQKNVVMLNNAHRVFDVQGQALVIAGVPDPTQGRFGGQAPDVQKALLGAPDSALIVLLSHQPKGARNNEKYGVDLQLSGHTHGGVMFFLKPIVAAFNEGFVQGLYTLGKMQLYVSSGTGLWGGFSCRIGVPAEITVLTLHRQENT